MPAEILLRAGAGPERRLLRFQAVFLAAGRTSYYKPFLETASLINLRQVARCGGLEAVLRTLPPTDLTAWLQRPEEFLSPGAPRAGRARVFFPGPRPRRAAILSRWWEGAGPNWIGRLLRWVPPDVLAGPAWALRRLAEAVERRRYVPFPIYKGIVAWIGPGHGFLTEEARELFWNAFGVPVFAQLVGPEREVLAWECEAHDGLHIESEEGVLETGPGELLMTSLVSLRRPAIRLRTGLTGEIVETPCGCGLSSPRLTRLRRHFIRVEPLAAAVASSAG